MMMTYQKLKATVRTFFFTAPLKTCWHCAYCVSSLSRLNNSSTQVSYHCLIDEQRINVSGGCAAWRRGLDTHIVDLQCLSAHEKAALTFTKASTYEVVHRDQV